MSVEVALELDSNSNLLDIAVKYASNCIMSDYGSTSYWIEKCTTKAIAFVEKIDNMLQQRQIIVKALGMQIYIEDPEYINIQTQLLVS